MVKQWASRFVLAVSFALAGLGMAQADDETGIAGIHSWVKVGRKTCMGDHFHSGSGSSSTRKLAERQAVQSWIDFTAWEYGTSWGRYSIAASKSMKCERAGDWSCFVEARPCRPY